MPQILKALLRIGVAFGEGLAESIGNSIVGLPARTLNLLPGGGLLTTLLYGGLTASIFFSGIRNQLFALITSVLTRVGTAQGSGMLYNLFVGSNPANTRRKIVGAAKGQVDGIAKDLAATNRRRGLMQLTQLSGFVIGAELLLGDLIGTTGAAIVGLGIPFLQKFLTGDSATAKRIITGFNSILAVSYTHLTLPTKRIV